jgi:hypothetical protein
MRKPAAASVPLCVHQVVNNKQAIAPTPRTTSAHPATSMVKARRGFNSMRHSKTAGPPPLLTYVKQGGWVPASLSLCPVSCPPQSVAACLSIAARRILSRMGTKSRGTIFGSSVRARSQKITFGEMRAAGSFGDKDDPASLSGI